MNGAASSREPVARIHLSKDPMKPSQKLPPPLCVRWLGRMEFARALALQEEIVAKKRNDPLFEDQLLLLEHEPVYTIGRTPDRSSLSPAPDSQPAVWPVQLLCVYPPSQAIVWPAL